MAYRNGISIVRHEPGVYVVRLEGRTVAQLWNHPGHLTTGWRSKIWYVENRRAGINERYLGYNVARAALRDDRDLLARLRQALADGAWL